MEAWLYSMLQEAVSELSESRAKEREKATPSKPTSKNKKDDKKKPERETLMSTIGKLMEEFIIPIEKQINENDDSMAEFQRLKLYIQLKTKSILAPLKHPNVTELAKTLEDQRKAALEVAINKLADCEAQKKTETIETFAARVQYAANECLSLITLGDAEDKMTQANHIRKMQYFIFVSGLEEEVRAWVVKKMPKDFVKAVILAMLTSSKLVEVKTRLREMEH